MDGDARPAGAQVRFYPPRLRLLLLMVGCLFLAAVGSLPARASLPLLAGFGWLMIVLMAGAAAVLLARVLRPGPTVVIDQQGITDRTTLAPAGLIAWDDITTIRKREIGRGWGAERLLEIMLRDPDGPARPRARLRRLVEHWRRLHRQPLVSIPASMVSAPLAVVVSAIQQHRPELEVLAGPPPPPSKFRFGAKPPHPRRQHPDLPRW